MSQFLQQVVIGLESGAIYASLALALVLIFRTTGIVNFAQGEMAMFSTFIAWTFIDAGMSTWPAIGLAMAISFGGGAAVERLLIRPVGDVEDRPLQVTIATIGLAIALNALAGWIWGDAKQFPRAFGGGRIELGSITVSRQAIGTLVLLLVVVGLLMLLFRRTKIGLAMRAVASTRESSTLVGIHVGRVLTFSWGLAATLGCLAGVLVAPITQVSPNMMQSLLVFAFAAAILGGFDSPIGAVVGGLALGVVEKLSARYVGFVGDDLAIGVAFLFILLVLLVRPQGLFGTTKVQRV